MINFRLLFLFLVLLFFIKCSVGVSDIPAGQEQQHEDSKKINSIIKKYTTSVYKLNIEGSALNLTLGLRKKDIIHYRKREFFVNRLLFEMSNYLDSIHYATVKITNINDLLKPVDTYTFDNTKLNILKNWKTNDPIYLYFMSIVLTMDNEKYEELTSIAQFFSNEFEDEKKLNTFDPDFAYYIDKFVNEMYNNPEGYRQRIIMENFYIASFDTSFKLLKPSDILQFTNYADSVYYIRKYPSEIKEILKDRKDIKY